MRFANVRELKNKTSEILRSAEKETVIITSKGKPRALIAGILEEDFEDYLLEHSPKLFNALEEAMAEYAAKGGISVNEYLAILKSREKNQNR